MNCSVDTCTNTTGRHGARGLCSKHYKRWAKHGDPTKVTVLPSNASGMEALKFKGWRVTNTGCWEWNGHRDAGGYGEVTRNRKPYRAHRLSYEEFIGPIPDGHVICHRCDNPPCINPEHLFAGTPKEQHSRCLKEGSARKG